MTEKTLRLPEPHSPGQEEILYWQGHGVVFAGRRWGKTQVAVCKLFAAALHVPGLYWWVGLSWRSASMRRAWRLLKDYARQVWKLTGQDATRHIRESDKILELPGGAEIWLRTAENAQSLAGEGVRGVVLDEFSLMPEAVWTEFVQATLLDYGGWALFMGVPKGQSWAAQLWRAAHSRKGWRAWQFPTVANPFIRPEDVEAIKQTLPERLFRQEYLAEVVDDAGAVFRRVIECATAKPQEQAKPGHVYTIGCDFARSYDFTVYSVVDVTDQALVAIDRFSNVDYALQITRLRGLNERFRPSRIIAESNSMGGPLTEHLQRLGLPVVAFQTTNASKAAIIEGLTLAFEQGNIRILPDPDLIDELQAFELSTLPSGMIRYAAPQGMHDDMVISLALAWQQAHRGGSRARVREYGGEPRPKQGLWTQKEVFPDGR